VPYFTGREEEIRQIIGKLQPGAIVTLWGAAGMGKTALASKVVEHLEMSGELSKRFPDGTLLYEFYGNGVQRRAESALDHIIRSFGEVPYPPLEAAARRVLAGRQTLLMLDGAEWAYDLIKVVKVQGSKGSILITSQYQDDIVEDEVVIGSLPLNKAKALLQSLGGIYAQNESALGRVYELVGGLTIAIDWIGHYLKAQKEPIEEYVKWLEKEGLDALTFNARQEKSVRVVLQRSISHVSDLAQQLLAISGLLAFAPIDRQVLSAALGVEVFEILNPLSELVDYCLFTRVEGRYHLYHNLLHMYAWKDMTQPAEAISRLATYYSAGCGTESAKD
jgi:hypothetical protein